MRLAATRIKVVIVLVGLAVLGLAFFIVRQPSGYPQRGALEPHPSAEPLTSPASRAAETTPEMKFETIAVPQITLQEFKAPHFLSARPAHKAVVALREAQDVRLEFDVPLTTSSRILVVVGNKTVGSAKGLAGGNSRLLTAPLATGAFDLADLPRGVYGVYYSACFAPEGPPAGEAPAEGEARPDWRRPQGGCFNGQYAFVGL